MATNKDTNKNYVTVKELADTIGISRVAVFNRIKTGKIKANKIGRNYIIYKEDAPEFFNPALNTNDKKELERGVKKVLQDYGDTLKMLGRE
jgi:excisionase family DNA binding protein